MIQKRGRNPAYMRPLNLSKCVETKQFYFAPVLVYGFVVVIAVIIIIRPSPQKSLDDLDIYNLHKMCNVWHT